MSHTRIELFLGIQSSSTCLKLYFKEIWASPKLRVLPSGIWPWHIHHHQVQQTSDSHWYVVDNTWQWWTRPCPMTHDSLQFITLSVHSVYSEMVTWAWGIASRRSGCISWYSFCDTLYMPFLLPMTLGDPAAENHLTFCILAQKLHLASATLYYKGIWVAYH